MCKFVKRQQEGQDQTYMFMELVDSSRHFQCLALVLSYINFILKRAFIYLPRLEC